MKGGSGGALRTATVLVLCALYCLLAMGVTLFGSSVYRGAVSASDENYLHRTALSYLVNQVRRSDSAGAVQVGSLDGCDAVALWEGDYVTYLYCYGGQLRELYTAPDAGLGAGDGVPILPLDRLDVSWDGRLLTFTAGGAPVSISPRCGAEEVGAL